MATLSALYIAIDDTEVLIDALRARAGEAGGEPVTSGQLDDEAAFYDGDAFFENFASQPRTFAVGVQQPGWATVHVGAFEGIGDLGDWLSAQLDARVVVGQGQTTSEAWRVSVHEKGRMLRHLEFADGDWVAQQGIPFAFETQPLGTNISEPGDEPFYDFGFDEVAAYCNELGLQFWTDRQPEGGWVWIRGGTTANAPSGDAPGMADASATPKSWWRRLLGM